jgi:predicted ATPase
MIKSVQFKNYKVLRDATLPLSRFTLIVGPNGSGKSTALQAFQVVTNPSQLSYREVVTAYLEPQDTPTPVEIILFWGETYEGIRTVVQWAPNIGYSFKNLRSSGSALSGNEEQLIRAILERIRSFSFDSRAIAASVQLHPKVELEQFGGQLAGVFDRLRDQEPERFEIINEELGRWFPEFDRILFDTPGPGQRAFLLRTRKGQHKIPATALSQGTLLALTILTLSYLQSPPSIICLEEPDHGVHPRLLRHIQEALYRLSYPEDSGEKREPVQVIATTHSPYFLDLYKDHPEQIVIAHKTNEGGRFERLSEQPHIMEILGDAPLGEVWYSGVLGGVPAEP